MERAPIVEAPPSFARFCVQRYEIFRKLTAIALKKLQCLTKSPRRSFSLRSRKHRKAAQKALGKARNQRSLAEKITGSEIVIINNVALLHHFSLLALLLHPLGVGSFLDVHDLLGNRSKRVCANAVSIRAEWRTYRRNHSLGGYTY